MGLLLADYLVYSLKNNVSIYGDKILITSMSGWNHKLEGLQLNPEESLHSLEFATSQEAWEKLNEGFLRLEPALFGKGGYG